MARLAEKEWTLMFYFASDTPLAPEILSQLKSIKQAGFHPDVNVIAHFDPHNDNGDMHVFDINRVNKIKAEGQNKNGNKRQRYSSSINSNGNMNGNGSASKIGFIGFTPNDPFIVNLTADKVWGDQRDANGTLVRDQLITSLKKRGLKFDPPPPPSTNNGRSTRSAIKSGKSKDKVRHNPELEPRRSLDSFLKFCRVNYPARHYMLFILGHGLVVANDTFLFDENAPEHFLKLQPFRKILEDFKKGIKKRNPKAEFDLISFHSCSMSSLEVAYELEGIANYMLASQSPSFVGSWPYRQILIRIFNHQERTGAGEPEVDIRGMIKNIFHYCLYNGYDFLVAGYSSDGCLCDLNKVSNIKVPLAELSESLIEGLKSKDAEVKDFVSKYTLLAHLDAQSYFNENYTDLFDFCFRLQQRFESAQVGKRPRAELKAITDACAKVMEVLQKGVEGDDDRLIIRSDFVGPMYQYSHGLSVYFPWSRPLMTEFWPDDYNQYKFVDAFAGKNSWSDFLDTYFDETMRRPRAEEFYTTKAIGFQQEVKTFDLAETLLEAFSNDAFNAGGQLEKPGGDSSNGDNDCTCQSIKNYPSFTRTPQQPRGASAKGKKRAAQNGAVQTGTIQSLTLLKDDPTFKPDPARPSFIVDGVAE